MTIRALRPDDVAVIEDLFDGLSPRSRHLRFHVPVPRLTGPLRRGLLDVAGRDRVALVAEDGDGPHRRPVGIAHLVRDADRRDRAEVAMAVVDAVQRRGVGRQLGRAVVHRATDLGIAWLCARVLPENAAAVHLCRSLLPDLTTRHEQGAVLLRGPLAPDAAPLRPPAAGGRRPRTPGPTAPRSRP